MRCSWMSFVAQVTFSPSPIRESPSSFIVPAKATVCQSFAFPSNRISGVAISHTPLLEVDTSEMNILGYSSQARRKSSMGSIASSDASSAQRARTILRKIPVSSWA